MVILYTKMGKKKDLIKETINLYKKAGWKAWFSKIRFWDAPFLEIEKLVPKSGNILDLGCGEGIFSNYLALSGLKRKIYGIELDKRRASDAKRGLPNTTFVRGDVLKESLPKSDTILMTHLLHHLPSKKDQLVLLKKVKKALKNGGKLIITEVDYKPFLKYVVSFITDGIIVPILFEGKLFNFNFFYRRSSEWKGILKEMGFKVKDTYPHEGKPFSHVILLCEVRR